MEASHKSIHKIVLTGGPCAGKTTAMSWVQNYFTQLGYTVLFVPETATELICGGISSKTLHDDLEFQKYLMALQRKKEEVFMRAARFLEQDKVLVVCDRGCLDSRAFMTEDEFQQLLRLSDLNEVELRDSYDAVFHMVTAAKGAAEAYTLANNAARSETPEQAILVDDRLIAAWTGHPHLRVIGNEGDFESKMRNVLREITAFLGEPVPYEIERKFLIKKPDLAMLEAMENCRKVEIIQTYLTAPEDSEVRVRQRGADGSYLFYKTEKRRINSLRRVEVEERLSQQEYLRLLMDADPKLHPVRKTRYCLSYEGRYYEIDIYPDWQDHALLELELQSEEDAVALPPFIHGIREVTEEERYFNHSLAMTGAAFPGE